MKAFITSSIFISSLLAISVSSAQSVRVCSEETNVPNSAPLSVQVNNTSISLIGNSCLTPTPINSITILDTANPPLYNLSPQDLQKLNTDLTSDTPVVHIKVYENSLASTCTGWDPNNNKPYCIQASTMSTAQADALCGAQATPCA